MMANESRSRLHELIIELDFCNRVSNKVIEILTDATEGNEQALQAPIETVFRDLIGNHEDMKKVLFDFCKLADLEKELDSKLKMDESSPEAESSSLKGLKRIKTNQETDEEVDIESLSQQGEEEQKVIAGKGSKKKGNEKLRVK